MQTFLFTDIESSTRLWEEHPAEMAPALARHDAILTKTVDAAGGRVLKTTGDGMIAVFDTVPDALSGVLEAQRALGAESWETTGPLKVRMGVHTGDTEIRDGDYFGPVMNRTARIMAAGHGGQILISQATRDASPDGLPGDATLLDLGMHRLKDLTVPEHLYQLVHPDLDAEFPALRTMDARPHNLPLQTTEFLGRGAELTAIQTLLETPSVRLVTIVGPGGAGKTRLGIQVAAEQLDNFRDGVFFVDLSAERDPDAAFEAVMRTLDLPVSGGGDSLQILTTRLRDRQMLLVLDNFEQITAAGTGVSELLQNAPELKIVVTSRETLRVRAEHVYPVPPLTLARPDETTAVIAESEAVQLFADRARAVRPDFTVGDDNAGVIAEICLRLDGLPLAIELAAARLNVFAPADLLERLRDRLDILGAGGRDLPDRQRTLWGAIGWSYELLDRAECELFEMMSVFSGARLEALEAVSGDPLVLDTLASLVDKSLVRTEQTGGSQRFSMLLMIKEYAAERLAIDPEREQQVRRAHAVHYSAIAHDLKRRLEGTERDAALADMSAEIGNLRTAWRYWVDHAELEELFRLIDALWTLHEAKGWYHAAIELAGDALAVLATRERSPELAEEELTLRTGLARALMAIRGNTAEVEEAFKQVLELSETTGTALQRFPVLRALATFYIGTADFEKGQEMGVQLLELGEREDDEAIRIEGHYVIGASTSFGGGLETGLAHLEKAIELYDPLRHGSNRFRLGPSTAIVARVASGLLRWQCGDLEQAVARVEEAQRVAAELDHPYSIAYAHYHSGFLALNRGRFDDTAEHARQLARVAEENDYVLWQTLAKVLQGVSLTAGGKTEEGVAMTEAGITIYQDLTTPPVFWPLVLALRSTVHAMAGNPAHALELIEEAIEVGAPDEGAYPEFRMFRGDHLRMLAPSDDDGAEQAYLAAIRGASGGGLRYTELQARNRLVTLYRDLGRHPDGSEELASLYEGFTEGHDEMEMVRARALLG